MKLQITEEEEYALYQSGLTAHGCWDRLDDYDKDAILRYGRILLNLYKVKFIELPK